MTETPTLAQRLRALHEAKKYHPSGPGGQMCGSEQYRLVATGLAFEAMQTAAVALEAQAAQIAAMKAREKACATMDEAQKVSLIRAMQECCQALGLDAMKTSPAELVKAVSVQAAQIAERDAQIDALRADALRYRWLRDDSVPPHNFYLSVPVEFDGVPYTRGEVDAAIDAAMAAKEPK